MDWASDINRPRKTQMKGIESFEQIYISKVPVDGRKFIDGLAAIVTAELDLKFTSNTLFVFANRKYNRVRCRVNASKFPEILVS